MQTPLETHTCIGIFGNGGRMGQAITVAITGAGAGATPSGGIGRDGDAAALVAASDVIVDFSSPVALGAHLAAARTAGTPILIGTTGLDAAHHALIDAAANDIAIIQAANTSL